MPVLRFILALLLILLQGIAPLVHAHAGGDLPTGNGNLHLPGLEAYSQNDPLTPDRLSSQPAAPDSFAICIDSGIEQKPPVASASENVFCLLPYPLLPAMPVYQVLGHYPQPPPPVPITSALSFTPQSPRAPPVG